MSDKITLTHDDILVLIDYLYQRIKQDQTGISPNVIKMYAVPRGGIPVAYLLLSKWHSLNLKLINDPKEAHIIVDDLVDSGETRLKMRRLNPMASFYCLIDKQKDPNFKNKWVIFPWEINEEGSIEDACIRLLQYVGEDPTREGLRETPKRMARAWTFWTSGMDMDPKEVFKEFEDGGEEYDESIMIAPIPFYSHCEHHMAAIFGTAYIAYIPNGKIAGLSKFPRLVDIFARRLQVQERLTTQIADTIFEELKPKGVAVFIKARHFCMESRGVQKSGVETKTTALRGCFKENPVAKAEFFQLLDK